MVPGLVIGIGLLLGIALLLAHDQRSDSNLPPATIASAPLPATSTRPLPVVTTPPPEHSPVPTRSPNVVVAREMPPAPPPVQLAPIPPLTPASPVASDDVASGGEPIPRMPSANWSQKDRLHPTEGSSFRVIKGYFQLKSQLSPTGMVQCDYRIPVGPNGNPLPSATDIVLAFPYPTEKASVDGIGSVLASQHGFTLLGIRFPDPKAQGITYDDRQACYYFPESGSGMLWVDALQRVTREMGSDSTRVFLFGRSGGASAAHLFSEWTSQTLPIEAAILEAPRVISATSTWTGPKIILYGEHDSVAEPCSRLIEQCTHVGNTPLVIHFFPNWRARANGSPIFAHSMPDKAGRVAWAWLCETANRLPDATMDAAIRDDAGQLFPGASSMRMSQFLPGKTRIIPLRSGGIVLIPQKPKVDAVAGTVIMVNERFDSDQDDFIFDVEQIAAEETLKAIACIPTASTNVQEFAEIIRQQSEGRRAMVIDHVGPIGQRLLANLSTSVEAVYLCDPQTHRLSEDLAELPPADVTVIIPEAKKDVLAPLVAKSPRPVSLMTIKPSKGSRTEARYLTCEMIVKAVKKIIK